MFNGKYLVVATKMRCVVEFERNYYCEITVEATVVRKNNVSGIINLIKKQSLREIDRIIGFVASTKRVRVLNVEKKFFKTIDEIFFDTETDLEYFKEVNQAMDVKFELTKF